MLLDFPVHADVELVRVFVIVAEGLFHVEEHVRPLAELMGEAEAYVVPGTFVFIGRVEAARIVKGADILIAQEFMKHVGLDIEGIVFAHILAEAEADAADQAVDSVELYARPLARRVVGVGHVSILELDLGLEIPILADVLLAAFFSRLMRSICSKKSRAFSTTSRRRRRRTRAMYSPVRGTCSDRQV